MSRETEYKEVMHKYMEDVIVSVICDGCGKTESILPKTWYEFSGHHSEWGNDSIDSYVYFHACSPKCYKDALIKAVKEFKNYKRSGKIDGMPYAFAKGLSELNGEYNG